MTGFFREFGWPATEKKEQIWTVETKLFREYFVMTKQLFWFSSILLKKRDQKNFKINQFHIKYRQSSAYTVLYQHGFLNNTVYFGTLIYPLSTKSLLRLHGFLLKWFFFQSLEKQRKQRTPCTIFDLIFTRINDYFFL